MRYVTQQLPLCIPKIINKIFRETIKNAASDSRTLCVHHARFFEAAVHIFRNPQSAPSRNVCRLCADHMGRRGAATELATALRTIVHYAN